MGNQVLKFVAYSNTNMAQIQQNSPKSVAASQNVLDGGDGRPGSPGSDPGTFDAPSLANAIGNAPKPNSFAAKIKAAQNGGQVGGGGGGMFGKY